MTTEAPNFPTTDAPAAKPPAAPPFGVNELRLNLRQWMIVSIIALAGLIAIPRLWKRYETFQPGVDYRLPYVLSKDYWLYQRRLDQTVADGKIVILGDSVVWGEYVRPDGTLSHFLNQQSGHADRFINGGVNGLFPLAMEGLVDHYGQGLRNQKAIVHCNMLWMTSPKADLSEDKEQKFNHSRLVPQFFPKIPCYKADASERLSAEIENHIAFFQWTTHLQNAYYGQQSVPQWTLDETGGDPPKYPNAWRNPLSPLRGGIPAEPRDDPQRGPVSRRHKPWNADGAEPTHFEWVALDKSLQWQALHRVIGTLRQRGNDVLVIVGPLNEHMIADDQLPEYHALRAGILAWMAQSGVAVVAPDVLESDLYADTSHPLTEGYHKLAAEIWTNATFQKWATAH